jgi:hypothetical protein
MHFSPACFCFCVVLCLYVCSALHWRRRRNPFFFLLRFGCITQSTRAVLDDVKRQRMKLSVGLGLYLVVPRIRIRVKVLVCPRAVLCYAVTLLLCFAGWSARPAMYLPARILTSISIPRGRAETEPGPSMAETKGGRGVTIAHLSRPSRSRFYLPRLTVPRGLSPKG